MSCRIWLRLDLPEKEFTSVRGSVTGCELWRRQDKEMSTQHLQQIDAVFTEEPLPDQLTAEMTKSQMAPCHSRRRERLFNSDSESTPHPSNRI